MDLVIDANVIFAALIKDGESARLILHDKIHLFAPEFLLEEFEVYRDLILKKTHRSPEYLDDVLLIIRNRINFITME